jgi:aldose 1-epimerase
MAMNPTLNFDGAHWVDSHSQRLCLLPSAGGGVAAWQWQRGGETVDLWRRWDGQTTRMQALASYPLLPWSNRISDGGFEHEGRFHPLQPNTPDDPYPIHGDGWLQPWTLADPAPDGAAMVLRSERFGGSPYVYEARQAFTLSDGGLQQTLTVTNRGPEALPFGLGQHPWFTRTPACRLTTGVAGVWMSRPDRIPTGYTAEFPDGWDLNTGAMVDRLVIDNGFGGWSGDALIAWPERNLALRMQGSLTLPDGSAGRPDCLLYAPAAPPVFCFEPISHPINAAHWPGRPGWVALAPGQSMSLVVHWRFEPIRAD